MSSDDDDDHIDQQPEPSTQQYDTKPINGM
jgi:hypothetical protein